jgi:HK97 family phage major capsid protein
MTAEDEQQAVRIGIEVDVIERRIRDLEFKRVEPQRRDLILHGLEMWMRSAGRNAPVFDEIDARLRTLDERNADVDKRMNKIRRAWGFPEIRAAYQVSPNSQGGYTVPQEWAQELTQVARHFSRVADLAGSVDTQGTGDFHVPVVVDAETAALIAEGGAYAESEDTLTEVVLSAFKYGGLAKASDEILTDAGIDLPDFVAQRAGQAIATASNPDLVNGNGTGKPRGITNNTVGVTLSSGQTTTITSADSFIDLFHAVGPAYRDDATWLLHDTTFKIARKLKGTDNQYILQPGLAAGTPDLILGRAAYADPDMPVPAANAKSVYFGDLGRNYLVRNAGPVTIKVLTELYSGNGYVGFRVDRRVDGDIVDTGAARVLQHSAT